MAAKNIPMPFYNFKMGSLLLGLHSKSFQILAILLDIAIIINIASLGSGPCF